MALSQGAQSFCLKRMPGLYVPLEQACLRRSVRLSLLHLGGSTAVLSVCEEPACHQAWEGGRMLPGWKTQPGLWAWEILGPIQGPGD